MNFINSEIWRFAAMKSSIYEYRDYKKCVLDQIVSVAGEGRGKRKELADHIGCQVSHITNVLSGIWQFNQEQAQSTASFFGFSRPETEFFLLLVQFNRAGTSGLRDVYSDMLNERQEKHAALKDRLAMPDSLKEREENMYYGSWHYGAVHVLLSIPEFQSRESIAERLELPISRVDAILSFLVETGLCQKTGLRYLPARPLIHLDKSSPLIARHHINWRLRTIQSLELGTPNDLHYSSVLTISKTDYVKVREILANALAKALKVVTASPEEEAAVLCMDLFAL
ncbi:MAG: TIGR02147 family protein [Proteobacteria bacterium]|nr:MAG: TIGR02147 family protein [Pseudomonadota bacterium]